MSGFQDYFETINALMLRAKAACVRSQWEQEKIISISSLKTRDALNSCIHRLTGFLIHAELTLSNLYLWRTIRPTPSRVKPKPNRSAPDGKAASIETGI
jgi:hypothetical protein